MNRAPLLTALAVMMLAGCGSGQGTADRPDPAKLAEARRANQSISDPRLPAGFSIYSGERGEVREFQIGPAMPGSDGKVATFSVIAQPHIVRQFYEDQAVASGMVVEGRVNAGEFMSVDARRSGEGSPHTFSAAAVRKGEYTNVTLQFDVVP